MFLAGEWCDSPESIAVRNPYDGAEIDRVPSATGSQVEQAIAGAVRGASVMRGLSSYDRGQILRRAADGMLARQAELGRLISSEEGKTLAEGVFEAGRATRRSPRWLWSKSSWKRACRRRQSPVSPAMAGNWDKPFVPTTGSARSVSPGAVRWVERSCWRQD